MVLADFAREIRLSARALARTPAWTLSLVLTIALGIGSNTSVDGFVRAVRVAVGARRPQLIRQVLADILLISIAGAWLLLGALGLYGVMTDATRRRRREFALRIALGAQGGHVIGQVIAEGMRLVVAGSVAGLVGWLLVPRSLAQPTPPGDPLPAMVWIAAPALLALAVLIASVVPARSAAASDPLMIMRDL